MLLSLDSLAARLVLSSANVRPRKEKTETVIQKGLTGTRCGHLPVFPNQPRAEEGLTFAPRVTSGPHLGYGHIGALGRGRGSWILHCTWIFHCPPLPPGIPVSHRGQHPVRCLLHREYWTEVCAVEVAMVYLKEPMTRALRKFSISRKATGSQPVIWEMKPSLQELEPQAFHPRLCKKILSFGTLHLLNTAD